MQRKSRAAQPSGEGSGPSVPEDGGGAGSFDASIELNRVHSPIIGLGGTQQGGSVYGGSVHGADANSSAAMAAASSLESRLRQLELQLASGGGGGVSKGGEAVAKSQERGRADHDAPGTSPLKFVQPVKFRVRPVPCAGLTTTTRTPFFDRAPVEPYVRALCPL